MQQIRRPVRDAAEARELLREMRVRNVSLADLARERGVDGRSLNMYRLNLEPAEQEVAPLRLVELVPTPTAASRYVVRCGELSVEVDDQFDDQVLRRLLRVVASC
jgi:hypothetical protein